MHIKQFEFQGPLDFNGRSVTLIGPVHTHVMPQQAIAGGTSQYLPSGQWYRGPWWRAGAKGGTRPRYPPSYPFQNWTFKTRKRDPISDHPLPSS